MPRLRPTQWAPAVCWFLLYVSGAIDGFLLSAAFSLLVAFPLTLGLDDDTPGWLATVAAALGVAVSASLLLPVGPIAAGIAGAWLFAAVPHAAYTFLRFLSATDRRQPMPWAEAMAGVGPLVAGAALIWSRYDSTFAGFGEPFATLTVTHFLFTFCLLPSALSALARACIAGIRSLWGFVLVPPVIGALFATRAERYVPSGPEALAVVTLAGVVFAWSLVSPRHGAKAPPWARSTVRFAGLGLMVATFVAAIFTVTSFAGAPRFDYRQMLSTHGLFNGVSTVALGVVAQACCRFRGISGLLPVADLGAATRDVDAARALFRDAREFDVGPSGQGRFDRVADALLAYKFYPSSVMISAATFKDEARPARLGDRIGMCLLVPLFPGLPAARFPATTEVNIAERTAEKASFGYVTTTAHYGRGAWCARIEVRAERVILTIESRMTPTHPLALLGLPVYRWFQKRAHASGARHMGGVR